MSVSICCTCRTCAELNWLHPAAQEEGFCRSYEPDKEGGEAVDVALPLIRGAALLVVQIHNGRILYIKRC